MIFAVFVCALAVHAGSVRLMFAMARDNNLPFAHSLAHVQALVAGPDRPVRRGRRAGRGDPGRERQPAQRDRDALLGRHRLGQPGVPPGDVAAPAGAAAARRRSRLPSPADSDLPPRAPTTRSRRRPYFSLGRWGLPVNAIAVVWGLFVVVNISWPRAEIYGSGRWGRFAAPLATLGLIVAGALYFCSFSASGRESWPSTRRSDILECPSIAADRSADRSPLDRSTRTR